MSLGMGVLWKVSAPAAAARHCIPVVLHEQNGIAGLTNQWLARIATTVMQAFPGAFPERGSGGQPGAYRRTGVAVAAGAFAGRDGPDSRVGGRRFSGRES